MTTRASESIVNRRAACAATTDGRHGATLLIGADLDRVAAAGSKPGGTGDGRGLLRERGETP